MSSSNSGKVSNSSKDSGFMAKAWSKTSGFFKDNVIALILIIVVLLFVLIILWIIFSFKNRKLSQKEFLLNPIRLNGSDSGNKIDSGDLPKSVVGREYTYSFWLYLESYTPTTIDGQHNNIQAIIPQDSLIFYRGNENTFAGANPIVTMDGSSNKLYIVIATQGSNINNTSSQDALTVNVPRITNESNTDYNMRQIRYQNTFDASKNLASIRFLNYFMNKNTSLVFQQNNSSAVNTALVNKHIILTVDYVPLQRWVNITFVIDNKICTVFMDGEIYSVKSTEEYRAMRETEVDIRGQPINVNLIVDKTDNNVYIGKTTGYSNAPPAFFSRLRCFNYAVSINEVKKIYNEGPVGGSMFGWKGSSYGVRSPIYKIGT